MSSDRWPEPDNTSEGKTDSGDPVGPVPSRMLRLTGVFVAIVAVGLLVAWVLQADAPATATIGAKAPDFEVRNVVANEPVILSDLVAASDRPIVLNLMASWCGPCRAEIPEISAFADANPDVLVLGVAVEDVYDDFKQFVTEVRPTYPVAFDDGEMRAAYRSIGLPATFFLDSNGNIVELFNGILNAEILEEIVAEIG